MHLAPTTSLSTALLSLVFVGVAAGVRAETTKIAVPDMKVSSADPGLGKILTEVLITEASGHDSISVVGSSDIEAMLGFEKEKDFLGCEDDVSCIAEMGGALGVDMLLISDLGQVGDTYVFNLKLIDNEKVKVLKRIYRTVSGKPDDLIQAVRDSLPEVIAIVTGEPVPEKAPASRAEAESPPPAATPEPPAVAAAPERKPLRWPQVSMITVGGLALSAAVVTDVFAFLANRRAGDTYSRAELAGGDWRAQSAQADEAEADTLSHVALYTGIGGAALLIGGVVWLILTPEERPPIAVAPTAATGGVTVSWTASF